MGELLETGPRKRMHPLGEFQVITDKHFDILYEKFSPYVTGFIWIGKMNSAVKRVRDNTGGMFPMVMKSGSKEEDSGILSYKERMILTE